MDYFVVALVGFLGGGYAVPVGHTLGLGPMATYLTATLGSLGGMFTFLYGGDRLRAWLQGRRAKPAPNSERLRSVRAKGPKWLGLIGPTFPGITLSAILGIAAGFDRKELARWMTIGIATLYAIYTAGLWLITQ